MGNVGALQKLEFIPAADAKLPASGEVPSECLSGMAHANIDGKYALRPQEYFTVNDDFVDVSFIGSNCRLNIFLNDGSSEPKKSTVFHIRMEDFFPNMFACDLLKNRAGGYDLICPIEGNDTVEKLVVDVPDLSNLWEGDIGVVITEGLARVGIDRDGTFVSVGGIGALRIYGEKGSIRFFTGPDAFTEALKTKKPPRVTSNKVQEISQ